MSLESDFGSFSSKENPLSREIRNICLEDLESPIKSQFLKSPPSKTSTSLQSPPLRKKKVPFNTASLRYPLQPHSSPSYNYKLYKAPSDPSETLHQLRNLRVPRFGELGGSALELEPELDLPDHGDLDDEDSIPQLMLDVICFNHQLELYEFHKTILVDKLEELLEVTHTQVSHTVSRIHDRGFISAEQPSNDSDQENKPPVWRTKASRENEMTFAKGALGITPLIPPLKGTLSIRRELSID